MSSKFKVTLVQTDIYWENISANLAHLEEVLSEQENGDIIILPEMFNTGFSMNAEKLAEPVNFNTFKWMKTQAARHDALIIGSLIVKESGTYYNRCVLMRPNGSYDFYDKAYSFRMMEEDKHFSSGIQKPIINWQGLTILPLVCYDLRFPEWSRNFYDKDQEKFSYDLLIYVANWPSARAKTWDILLQARAIENSCYVAGVNRVGTDGNGIEFSGHSAVTDPRGNYLIEPYETERVQTVELDLEQLTSYRNKFQVHLDW